MSNTFFSQFLMITNIHTIIMIALLVGLFVLVNKLKGKVKFTNLMIISIFLGLGLGIIIQLIAKFQVIRRRFHG